MEFKIKIGDSEEIRVDNLEFGVSTEGTTDGWADVFISVRDMETDIYTDESKKIWIEWLNDNCGDKNNPEKRVLPVEAKIYSDQETVYRSVTIENAYLASYVEDSMGAVHSYSAVIRRAPTRKGDIKIKATDTE